jgi:hypothetical protein
MMCFMIIPMIQVCGRVDALKLVRLNIRSVFFVIGES